MNKGETARNVVQGFLAKYSMPTAEPMNGNRRLISDFGLESIDLMDLFFEIDKATGSEKSLLTKIGSSTAQSPSGNPFDVSIDELVVFAQD